MTCPLRASSLHLRWDIERRSRAWSPGARTNYLHLNVSKTKDVVIDFRRQPTTPLPLFINGEEVEIADQYKYLGSIIDSRLDWSANALALLKKGNQRLYFLKKLKAFGVGPRPLELFYKATTESVAAFNILCHFGSLKEHDRARLSRITKVAGRLVGHPVTDFQTLFETRAKKKLRAIQLDQTHPLCDVIHQHVSDRSGRLISFASRTERLRRSFLPTAVRLVNG